jgi:hypothetical protein
VIDAYMGHAGGRTPEHGSRIGRVYRETTDEMRLRVVAALEERLAIVLKIAEEKAATSPLIGSLTGKLQTSARQAAAAGEAGSSVAGCGCAGRVRLPGRG